MGEGSYEKDAVVVRGDVFMDRFAGWMFFSFGLPILGVAIHRVATGGVEPVEGILRLTLIVMGLAALLLVTRSRTSSMKLARALELIRMAAATGFLIMDFKENRMLVLQIIYGFIVLGYTTMRIHHLSKQE